MTSPAERIRDLARKSALAPEDAERLLAAMRPDPIVNATWNPFDRWSAERCIAIGVVCALAGAALSRLGLRYDGFLDQHHATSVSWSQAVVDQIAVFPLGVAAFWTSARVFAPRVRLVDVAAAVALTRLPATAFSIPLALIARTEAAPHPMTPLLAVGIAVDLAGLALQVTTLVLGFRTATGLRGPRLVLAFLGALVVAEVASKILVSLPI